MRRAPRVLGAVYGGLGLLVSRYPDLIFVLNKATKPDQAALEDRAVRETLRAAAREAFRGGTAGPLHELRLISLPWGFDLGRLDAEVVLWQGSEDGVVPCKMARRLASEMPAADLRLLPGEGHISLPVRHAKEILAAILP